MSIKGTETEKNLLKAFAGESQARNRYIYAAKVARKANLYQIADLFEETALNEEQHAKVFFEFLEGGMLEITASYPAGVISDTADNLEAAAAGELEEWSELYPHFADVAEKEGFKDIATKFRMIARVEVEHEKRFRALLERLKTETIHTREDSVAWKCRVCGYVHVGKMPPVRCPACAHSREHFEIKAENY